MKRLALRVIVLILILPAIARADTIGVRSGDHAGFTRLVVQFGPGEDWVFGRVDGGFELRPGRGDIRYRLDRVYDKIGRTRIADVRDLGDGRLFLAVDCACHGVVDQLADGQVVLDIAAGAAREPGTGVDATLPSLVMSPDADRPDAPQAPVEIVLAPDPPRKPGVVSDRAGLPLTLPRIGLPVSIPDRWSTPAPAPPAAALDQPGRLPEADELAPADVPPPSETAPVPAGIEADRQARIAQTETRLLEQVARAAAQGLLDADMAEVEKNVAEAIPLEVDTPPAPEFEHPRPSVAPRGHVAVQTSVDRAVAGREARHDETDQGDACIDPRYFDIATWGGPVENGTGLGAYRSRIVGEFDVADGAGVTALARNYIYITFGAEAKALMRRYPGSVERPDVLFAMAEIMDDGQSTAAADLADQMACDGATALWATLAQPVLRPGQSINRNAVALAFGLLPAHLRRHLGPGLADEFLGSGDRETADLIRASIDRASRTPTSEYDMLTARLDLDTGHVDQATKTLDDVVAAGDASLPEALLQRVKATLESGGAVPEDIVVLLDGLALQFRGTEIAGQMADAGIRARASTLDFAAAFEQLDATETAGLIPHERGAVLRAGLFDRLVQDTSDTDFLRLVLPRFDAMAELPIAVRRELAARLLDLGFARPAREALGRTGAMPEAADRSLLARGALLEGRPAVAIGYLAGLSDLPATRLRADALAMARDNAGAARAYQEAGDAAAMLRAAWQGGLWADVATLDQGPIGAAARLMTGAPAGAREAADSGAQPSEEITPGPTEGSGAVGSTTQRAGSVPDDQSPLTAARALIAQSKAARKTLDALLEVVAPPQAAVLAASPGS